MLNSDGAAGITNRHLPAYLLCGGASIRFSAPNSPSDKLRADIDGRPQLISILSQLSAAGHTVQCVANNSGRFADLGVNGLVDCVPGAGPISGLLTALRHRRHALGEGSLICVGGDQLRWDATWSQLLERQSDTIDSVTFCRTQPTQAARHNPLPGRYHTRLIEPILMAIQAREFSLQKLLAGSITFAIAQNSETRLPSEWSFNTKEQLSDLLRDTDWIHRQTS